MTIRELLTTILQRNREMEIKAKNDGNYADALKKTGSIETAEIIFLELHKSRLMDEEI